jgi:isopentenyl-diphosphate delta-isomerase type 1
MPEFMDVVDENDRVIGKATREEIHNSGMWHRGVHVLVFNSKNELFLPLRSARKDKFPETYDCSVSEHVKSGETFDEAALRGMEEELKIINPVIKRLLKFRMNYGPNDNTIAVLYKCKCKDKVEINRVEVKNAKFMSLGKIKELLNKNESKFAPWTREILKWYFRLPSKIEEIKE